ncbi:SURF1 family protein [Xylaria sp. FL0933]|nr:SURF1 family protein [Xylaria sp. FL0933]
MKSAAIRLSRHNFARQVSRTLSQQCRHSPPPSTSPPSSIISQFVSRHPHHRPFTHAAPLHTRQPGDDPTFTSILDNPPELVRTGRRHGPGLIILALIPLTALVLGTWQVQRLGWKSDLIARFEDRLVQPPLPLPPRVDPEAIHDFDFRRVVARGRYRHDQEMLIGPRMRDGESGYMVVTPLERDPGGTDGKGSTTVLVNRGWVSKALRRQRDRPEGLPTGEVVVEGLLREPWKKNMFTPDNRPDKGEFYFPDVQQMAELTASQAVWVEQTMGTLRTRSYSPSVKIWSFWL